MGLKTLYHKLEDRYFNFLDKLESKGINLYKIVDPLEKKGIPTFLILNILILGILVLLGFLIFGGNAAGISDNLMLTFVGPTGNAISNQEFRVMFGDTTKTLQTDELGVSKVSGLEEDIYELKLIGGDYKLENPLSIDISEKTSFEIVVSENVETVSKTISFSKNGETYFDELIVNEITCSDNLDYRKEDVSVTSGELVLDDVPYDCGRLNVLIYDSEIETSSLEVDYDNTVGEIYLSDVSSSLGNLTLNLVDSETKTPISNLTVSIVKQETSQILQTLETNENGVVLFENVAVGKHVLTVYDNSGIYGEITPYDGVFVDIFENEIETKEIALKKEIVGFIKLKLVDSDTGSVVSDVQVTLKKGNEDVVTLNSSETGEVSFGVKENIAHSIVVDHASYIKKLQTGIMPSDSVKTINLVSVNQENSRGVIVKVVDEKSSPVEYAYVKLYDAGSDLVISDGVTDTFGQVVFANLDTTKTYKLEANKGKYVSDITNAFMISERELNEQVIKMKIGNTKYNLEIKDEFGEAFSTSVSVFDFYDNRELLDLKTNTSSEGQAFINVRADREVYFVINNYDSKFITNTYSNDAETSVDILINLPKPSNSSSMEFIGYFNKKGEQITTVTPGQNVIARFVLNVGKNYSKAVAHIRTGKGNSCDNKNYTMDSDQVYIRKIDSASKNIFGSKSYTPCLGETTDLASKVTTDAKWLNIEVENPMIGSYLIDSEIVVLDSAYAQETINYRAEFYQSNNVLRYPVDDVLKTSISSSNKQSLYAYSKEVQIPTGQSNFCNSLMCYSFSVFDKTSGISKNIIDTYTAKEDNSYRMYFSLNVLNKAISNPFLSITTGNSNLNTYEIEAVNSQVLKGSEFENISLEKLGANDHISGVIDFDVVSENDDFINFTIMSDGEVVFTKIISLKVKPSKLLEVELIPRSFVPFVSSDVILTTTDDTNNPIKDSRVNVYVNDESILDGKTNADGIFGFVLPATDLGDRVKIIVVKNGYKKIVREYVISEDLVDVLPEELEFTINLSDEFSNNSYVTLKNNTLLDLTIRNARMSTENAFLDYDVIREDTEIKAGETANILLNTYLSEDGINLEIIKNIKNNILVDLSHSVSEKDWTIKIPVETRITLGNSLDNLDCLEIEPNNIEYRTVDDKVESIYVIRNKCSVSGVSTFLSNVTAKLDWRGEGPNGNFSMVIDNKNFVLEEGQTKDILNKLDASDEVEFKLVFTPSETDSAVREPVIVFESSKPSLNGVEEVKTSLNLKTVINKFNDCLTIPDQASLLACNWFGGMGLYNQFYGNTTNRFSNPSLYGYGNYNVGSYSGLNYSSGFNPNRYYNPTNNYNYGLGYTNQSYSGISGNSQVNYSNGYIGQNLTNTYQAQYPSSYLNNGIGQNYMYGYDHYNFNETSPFVGGMQYSNMMSCPQTPIYIQNSCVEDVEIKIESTSGVSVSNQDSVISIPKNERETINLQAGETMGSFNLPVYARADTGLDTEFTFIKDIKADVTLPLSYMPSQCIQVAPQKLDFSGIADYKYKEVEIINTCFDQGYRIVAANILDLD